MVKSANQLNPVFLLLSFAVILSAFGCSGASNDPRVEPTRPPVTSRLLSTTVEPTQPPVTSQLLKPTAIPVPPGSEGDPSTAKEIAYSYANKAEEHLRLGQYVQAIAELNQAIDDRFPFVIWAFRTLPPCPFV